MKKNNITPAKASSFLEMESRSIEEKDDYDDDDFKVEESKDLQNEKSKSTKKNIRKDLENSEDASELNLLEKNLSRKNSENLDISKGLLSKKRKSNKDFVYNRPRPDKTKDDKEKTSIFRNRQMTKLQNRKTFQQANRENISEKYSLGKASLGNDNVDEFVSFLGYLRDASFKASQLIAKKEEEKLAMLLKEEKPKKRKDLNTDLDKDEVN